MITLRNAREDDKAFLWRLKVASMRKYIEAVYGWNEMDQYRFFEKGFLPKELQIIQFEGRDVGMYNVQVRENDWFLCRIEVLPDCQKKGIGTAAIKGIIDGAREAAKPLRLQVFKVNPAKNLYRRLGFVVTGESETHIQMELSNKALQETQTGCAPEL